MKLISCLIERSGVVERFKHGKLLPLSNASWKAEIILAVIIRSRYTRYVFESLNKRIEMLFELNWVEPRLFVPYLVFIG